MVPENIRSRLEKIYVDKSGDISKWLRTTFALTYLNPSEVGDSFTEDLFSIMPENEKVIKYADYLVDTYISEEASYPPKVWAEQSNCITRTTNACESFSSHFNSSFYSSHPNLFTFLEKLKEFQVFTYVKIQSVQEKKKNNSHIEKKQKMIKLDLFKKPLKQSDAILFLSSIRYVDDFLVSFVYYDLT